MSGFRAIAILIARLWAAATMISVATYLAGLVFVLSDSTEAENFLRITFVEYTVLFIVALTVWVAAPSVTRAIAPTPQSEQIAININGRQFVAIGSFLIGAYHLVDLAPRFIVQLLLLFGEAANREADAPIQLTSFAVAGTLERFAVLLVALFLTFRPYQIASFFSSLRRAGLTPEDQS